MNYFTDIKYGVDKEYINSVIEIPKGSMLKIEYNHQNEYFELDRVEPGIFGKPVNYGFIPQTLDEDGDPLDTLVVTTEPLPMGLVVKCRVIGIMNFEDDGEMDHKIICVVEDDRHYGEITDFQQLGMQWQKQIEHHFNHYKDLKKGGTKVLGFEGQESAWECIADCLQRQKAN